MLNPFYQLQIKPYVTFFAKSLILLLIPASVYGQWTTSETVDEMEGTTSYFAISPDVKPTRQMTFPYGDITSNLVIACKEANTFAYFYFSDSPNLSDDETEDGYNLVRTRLKADEVIENISLTQTWGANSLFLLNDEPYIQKAKEASEFLLELNWYGNGKVYFRYDLSGSAKIISEVENNCGIPQRLEAEAKEEEQEKLRVSNFSKKVEDYFTNSINPPTLMKMVSGFSRNTLTDFLNVQVVCNDIDGFEHVLITEFVDGSVTRVTDKHSGSCPTGKSTITIMGDDIPDNIINQLNSDYSLQLEDLVQSLTLSLTGNVSSDLEIRPVGASNFEGYYEFSIFQK